MIERFESNKQFNACNTKEMPPYNSTTSDTRWHDSSCQYSVQLPSCFRFFAQAPPFAPFFLLAFLLFLGGIPEDIQCQVILWEG